jgi:hypothetical protein
MKRFAMVGLVLGVLALATSAYACCGQSVMAASPVVAAPVTTYYAPGTSASVVTGSPMPTAVTATTYYAPTVTTYYAPAEPVTAYYAPTTAYYAPTTAYYAPTTAYYSAPVTSYYAPYTTYYAPSTTYYSPYSYTTNYAPGYVYYPGRVPGQPIRNLFRRY